MFAVEQRGTCQKGASLSLSTLDQRHWGEWRRVERTGLPGCIAQSPTDFLLGSAPRHCLAQVLYPAGRRMDSLAQAAEMVRWKHLSGARPVLLIPPTREVLLTRPLYR